jgi:hypothetical protein
MEGYNPWNNFYLVVSLFVGWTAVMFTVMKARTILWDFDKFPEDDKK